MVSMILVCVGMVGCGSESAKQVDMAQVMKCENALDVLRQELPQGVEPPQVDCKDPDANDAIAEFITEREESIVACQTALSNLIEMSNGNVQASDFDCELPETSEAINKLIEEKKLLTLPAPKLLSFGYKLSGNQNFTVALA